MKLDRLLRAVLAFAIFVGFLLALAATLFLTESALNVWDRLRQGPAWILYGFSGLVVSLAVFSAWLLWRFVVPRRRAPAPDELPALTRDVLQQRIDTAQAAGVDTASARAELARLGDAEPVLSVILFGEISAGKSSLINALLPGASAEVGPAGGTTRSVNRYRWRSPGGVDVQLLDAPGISGADDFDAMVSDESAHAHLAVFVCDDDLTRQEAAALGALMKSRKPVVVALNKADRYSEAEIEALTARIHERLLAIDPDARVAVVPVQAGGDERYIEIDAGGREHERRRARPTDIGQLSAALNNFSRQDPRILNTLRDRAVFNLAAEKLQRDEQRFRERRSAEIVRSYTHKAVIGALAAISPGTDIVIQGYLGTAMTRDLCRLFGQSPRDLDIEKFLNLSQSRVGKTLPLTLAVAGNGLKAFPGVGTVAGGLVHAVAYGLIFDALGRSLSGLLAERQPFSPRAAADGFGRALNQQLESRVPGIARLALTRSALDDSSQ